MLLELLRSLTAEDWEKQTVSPKWKVKDVAAHLLDTPLRGVSIARDGYLPEAPRISSSVELAAYINRLNEEDVRLYRRLSPAVLISLMQVASQLLAEYHRSRDPDGNAPYGVSWAGEEKSANWFDTVRETYVQINVSGECGGSWYLSRAEPGWQLTEEPLGDKLSETTIPQEIAWRIFTKGIDRESALPQVKIWGDTQLGLHALQVISIVA